MTLSYLLSKHDEKFHQTCVIEQTWQRHQEFQPKDAEEHVGMRSGRHPCSYYKQQQHISWRQKIFLKHYRPLVGKPFIYIYSKIMRLYLQNVHGLAGILVPASFCRKVSILCFGPGCGGAVHTW